MNEQLWKAVSGARHLRFVCSGNMVRSAFAELLARHLGCPIPADSLGTTFQNSTLHPRAHAALAARAVPQDLLESFRPRLQSAVPIDSSPGRLVLGMTREHLRDYQARFGGRDRAFLVLELLGREADLPDPVLEGASFQATFDALEQSVRRLITDLGGGGSSGLHSPLDER